MIVSRSGGLILPPGGVLNAINRILRGSVPAMAGYHENTMIGGWLTVHGRGRARTMGQSETHIFRHFRRRRWTLKRE